MTSSRVEFPGRPGRILVGTCHRPPDGRSQGSVVVAHGMLSSRQSPKHRALCEGAAAAGLTALRFDFAGRGDSPGVATDLTVSGEIRDLEAAVRWCRHAAPGPVAVVGSSLGGAVAVLAAPRLRLSALVTIAAPSRLPDVTRAAWHDSTMDTEQVPTSFFEDARSHDPARAACDIACPWRILHGAADDVVPAEHAGTFAAAAPRAELLIHPRAGHRFWSTEHRRWIVDRVVEFLVDACNGAGADV
jgi:alpha-beta hydrolase superfamily lysophospholipase